MFFDGLVHAFPIDAINLTILMIQFPRLQSLINPSKNKQKELKYEQISG